MTPLKIEKGNVLETVFEAHTPNGSVYRVFEDGSTAGFPEGTWVSNRWIAMLNFERGSRIKAINEGLRPDVQGLEVGP